jgi:hypothetical protein
MTRKEKMMVEQNCVYNGQRIHAEVCCYLGLHELLLEREKNGRKKCKKRLNYAQS